MDILITVNSGLGAQLGPNFNLTSNVGTVTPSTATRAELIAGKLVTVNDSSTAVYVTSIGVCTSVLTIDIGGITTTTTSTAAPTSTTTSTSTSTTQPPVSVTLAYSNVNGPTACYKFTDPSPITSTYYLRPGELLADGYTIYTDSIFTTIAPDGFYSNGVDYWEVNVAASGGVLSNGTPCPQTTTTTTSTTSTSTSTTSTSTSTSTSTTSTTTAAPTTTTTTSGGGGTTTTTTGGPTTYTYLGRSSPNSGNSLDACTAYTTTRGYISLKSNLSLITIGDIIYDSYPSTPTNGGDNWIALKSGGVGDAYSFRINSSGAVTLIGGNCSGGTTTTTTSTTTTSTTTTTTTAAPVSAPTVDTCSGQTNLAIFNSATAVSLGYTNPVGPGGNLLTACTLGGSPLATGNSDSWVGVFAPSYSTQLSGANGKQLRTWKNGTLFSTINITSSPITVVGDAAFGGGDLVILEVVN
jgi:hypothetical protein